MLRTKWGTPCVPDPSGHYPDWFRGRRYSSAESLMDANCLSDEPVYPSCPVPPVTPLRRKGVAVSEEFKREFPFELVIDKGMIENA